MSRAVRVAAVLPLVVCLLASDARAEAWYEGRHGKNRVLHVSIALAGGLAYFPFHAADRLIPTECRWCTPTGFELDTRDALRWDHTTRAMQLSDIGGYLAAPLVGVGLVMLHTPPSVAGVIDDVVPMLETLVVTAWLTHGLKIAIARQRPYAYAGMPRDREDNLSLPSGHASTAFALGTSAAMVARMRGYASERLLWASGIAIGATTAYLRIAGDQHYVLDALAGSMLGVAVGLTVPRLMRRDLAIVPTSGGIALSGSWR